MFNALNNSIQACYNRVVDMLPSTRAEAVLAQALGVDLFE
jgi:hypothetical protein